NAVPAAGSGSGKGQLVVRPADLICDLISAPDGCLSRAEPWKLPGKADCRPEIVVVVLAPRCVWIRRVLTEERNERVLAANSGFHPIRETGPGNTPNVVRTSGCRGHEPVGFVERAEVVPTQAKIERQALFDF